MAHIAHLSVANKNLRDELDAIHAERERLSEQLHQKAVSPELRAEASQSLRDENALLRQTIHEMMHDKKKVTP